MLTGKRYELTAEEYRRSQRITGMAVEPSQLKSTVNEDEDVEEQLPNDPEK